MNWRTDLMNASVMGVACLVEASAQPGQPLVTHQHQVALLGLMAGCGGVEAGRPVLDGVEAIARQGFADRKLRALERLRGKPLHRIAVDGVDFWIFDAHGVVVNPVNRRLPRRRSKIGGWLYRRKLPVPTYGPKVAVRGSCRLIVHRYFA
jgi:hypothetical protein